MKNNRKINIDKVLGKFLRTRDGLFNEAQKQDLKNLLTKGLTRAERLVFVLHYYEGMTMKEIGSTLDLPESRISLIHFSILKDLTRFFFFTRMKT